MSGIEYSMQPLSDTSGDTVAPATFGGTRLPGKVEAERILIVRTNTVMVPVVPDEDSEGTRAGDGVVVAFLEEMRNLGYWVNEELLCRLRLASADSLARILDAARKAKGADVEYRPMYPNFPKQVAEASDLELWVNAVIHYIGRAELGIRIMPVYDVEKRVPLEETTTLTVLGAASDQSIAAYVTGIVSQGRPYSEADKESILLFKDFIGFDEVRLGVKENLVWFASTFKDRDLGHVFATVTDVLRYAVALSDGDITLATPSRINLSRPQRRQILGLLEQVAVRYRSADTLAADMAARQERWKRLAHALHAHEWQSDGVPAYPRATAILSAAQSSKLRSYESTVDRALAESDLDKAIAILGQRPGMYARNVMALLRRFPGQGERARILRGFGAIADQVSSPVLIQLWNLLHGPTSAQLPWKTIVIKAADRQKTAIIGNRMTGLDNELAAIIEQALRGRHKSKFIELGERADDYTVPLNVRNASAGARQIGRGSHVHPKDDKNIVRMFTHWHDLAGNEGTTESGVANSSAPLPDTSDDEYLGNGRYRSTTVDLDLSAVYMDADFTRSSTVSYYNLRDTGAGVTHSGDITSAPHGAAEFIDVDRKAALAKGYRYVAPVVHSFSGQRFARIPEVYAGIMFRDCGNAGEIFEPSTVEVKYDLGSDDVNSVPFLYDLLNNEIIWWNIAAHDDDFYRLNNVAANQNRIAIALKTLLLSRNMSVGCLARLSATVVRRVALDDDLRAALRDVMRFDGVCSEGTLPADADHVWALTGEGRDGAHDDAVDGAGDASADGSDARANRATVRVHVHNEDRLILPTLRDKDVEHIDGWESEKVLGLLG